MKSETSVEAPVCVWPVTAPARQKKGRIGLDDAAFCLAGRYGLSGEAENEA